MKVQCGQCPAKYAVADERIRDKKVRIRCRRCNAAIVVDGKVSPPLVTSTPAQRSARPLSSLPPEPRDGAFREVPESLPPPSSPDADQRPSPRPVAHTMMGGLEAPEARQLVTDHVIESQALAQAGSGTLTGTGELRAGMPEPHRGFTEPPPRDEVERWRVALTQQDLRWMTTEEITEAFRDGAVKSETFVFKAGMPTWVTLLEVSEIARALADADLVDGPLEGLGTEASEAVPSSPPRRVSSLPPPRKVARSRGQAEDAAAQEPASDSEESLPFNLVTGRLNGAQKPDSPTEAESEAADAAEADRAAPAAALDPAAAAAANGASSEAEAPATAAAAIADPQPATPSPVEPAPVVPAAAAPARSGSIWIWLILAVLLLAAAAFFVGPRFGLQLH